MRGGFTFDSGFFGVPKPKGLGIGPVVEIDGCESGSMKTILTPIPSVSASREAWTKKEILNF